MNTTERLATPECHASMAQFTRHQGSRAPATCRTAPCHSGSAWSFSSSHLTGQLGWWFTHSYTATEKHGAIPHHPPKCLGRGSDAMGPACNGMDQGATEAWSCQDQSSPRHGKGSSKPLGQFIYSFSCFWNTTDLFNLAFEISASFMELNIFCTTHILKGPHPDSAKINYWFTIRTIKQNSKILY